MPGLLRFVADPLISCSSYAGYSLVYLGYQGHV